MSDPKFVDDLPPITLGRHADRSYIAKLRANPGQWAEMERAPKSERLKLSNKGRARCANNPGLESTTRTIGDETVLYMRAVER